MHNIILTLIILAIILTTITSLFKLTMYEIEAEIANGSYACPQNFYKEIDEKYKTYSTINSLDLSMLIIKNCTKQTNKTAIVEVSYIIKILGEQEIIFSSKIIKENNTYEYVEYLSQSIHIKE